MLKYLGSAQDVEVIKRGRRKSKIVQDKEVRARIPALEKLFTACLRERIRVAEEVREALIIRYNSIHEALKEIDADASRTMTAAELLPALEELTGLSSKTKEQWNNFYCLLAGTNKANEHEGIPLAEVHLFLNGLGQQSVIYDT